MFKPLNSKDYASRKSPISRVLIRLGMNSTGFKTPNARKPPQRNENQCMNKNKSLNKSNFHIGLRENCRSVSPIVTDELHQYEITETLGKGAYGLVKLALEKSTGIKHAVKIYEKSRLTDTAKRANVNREIVILKKIKHPNVISFIKMIENKDCVYLFTEFVPGTSLYAYLSKQSGKKLPENTCKLIFKQIIGAVSYCHSLKVSHRDIKLENILIYNNQAKLIDFGFAIANQAKCRTFCGTPSYMAPELVNHEEYSPFSVDIWALGVLVYTMLCGKFPFSEKAENSLYASIRSGKFEMPNGLSESAKEIITLMLCVDPEKRSTTEQLIKHRWFSEEVIDKHIIRHMVKLGHDPRGIDEAVLDKSSYLSVIYDRFCITKSRGEIL